MGDGYVYYQIYRFALLLIKRIEDSLAIIIKLIGNAMEIILEYYN